MRYQNLYGADPEFISGLERLIAESPYANDITVFSGKRTLEHQRELFERSDRTGRTVARPTPHAPHVRGVAADLGWRGGSFKSMPANVQRYLQANALRYGLHFPMSYEPWHIQKHGGGLSGGGSSNTMAGGIREGSGAADMLVDETPVSPWKQPNYDPIGGGSKHEYQFDRSTGRGQYKTSDGRIINYSEPQGDNMNRDSISFGGGRNAGKMTGLFSGGGIFKGGILTGNRQKAKADSDYWTKSEQKRLEARLGPDWQSQPKDVLLRTLYPPPKGRSVTKGTADEPETRKLAIPDNADAEIERLAGLDPIAYERERQAIADRWGVRVQTVDRAVTSKRNALRKAQSDAAAPVNNRGGQVTTKVVENAVKMAQSGVPIDKIEDGLRKMGIDPREFRKALGK